MQLNSETVNLWVEQSLQNDEKAFRKIVESYQSMVYSLVFRLLCNEDEAKDMVQETFIKVWIHLNKYNREMKFSTWIYAVATNLCLDKLKSKNNKNKTQSFSNTLTELISGDRADEKLLNTELAETIEALTNHLTPKQRIVFTLRYIEELEVEEIVQITGMSSGKIKSNLFLARQNIREKLENY